MHRFLENKASYVLMGLLWIIASTSSGRADLVQLPSQPANVPWPTHDWPKGSLPEDLDRARFDERVEQLFADRGRGGVRDTRALLIVQGGLLIFERYAEEFGPDQRFQSWSMAKSVTHALVGILVRRGVLDIEAPAPVPAWQQSDDPRSAITLGNLLHMTSGLDNADGFITENPFVGRTLFGPGRRSPAAYAADVPLLHPPGTHWAYSTATSLIVTAILGRAVGNGAPDTLDFMREELIEPLGMSSARPEFALSGEFMGGAFFHATARDWARFGTLYLRDGMWEDRRILPEGWVDHARTPGPAPNSGIYGGHFWVNSIPSVGQWNMLPSAPSEVFAAEGAGFQLVAMDPTRDLVFVRLGEAPFENFAKLRRLIGETIILFPVRDTPSHETSSGTTP